MLAQTSMLASAIEDADEHDFVAGVPPPALGTPEALAVLGRLDCMSHARAASRAIANHVRANEGASFLKIAPDAELIVVRGAQPLHHDRHMFGMAIEGRSVEHTWNYVVESDEAQLLLVEVAQDSFAHFSLEAGSLIYFNTVSRHLVSRSNPLAQVVIAQVCGFGPDEGEQAAERLRDLIGNL